MHPPREFSRIINRRRYDVETATLIASDTYWDGHNFERHGCNTFLYRTPHGNYFVVRVTQWIGERDTLKPVSQAEALDLYENQLSEHEETYADAFPDVQVTDA
ncbi:MAG: hypothetical protein HDKAJFGB_01813 [Anaerolineae bacterium]|nr:hypothetical protein [Anaerolineae bacterium]RIK15512.1 MAG: hypothetical protein DCC52_18620 [Chloroflexota bacterium]